MEDDRLDNIKSLLSDPEVKNLLIEILDEESIDVVYALMEKKATDEEISEETGLRLNTVRRALYKLYEYRIASYNRTKDREIGWYIYTWTLHLNKVNEIIKTLKKRKLEDMKKRLEFEQNNVFFRCRSDNTKVPFDRAADYKFRCPRCNGVLEYVDNIEMVMNLKGEVKRLEEELSNGARENS
ncbi:MAG TPA: transcription factor E [Euryarchaeota archaeon]|nr:transcription factor E [Euryarchaeota archaeon]